MDHQKDPSKLSAVQEADLFLESMSRLEIWAKHKLSHTKGKKKRQYETALANIYGQLQFLLTISQKELK